MGVIGTWLMFAGQGLLVSVAISCSASSICYLLLTFLRRGTSVVLSKAGKVGSDAESRIRRTLPGVTPK